MGWETERGGQTHGRLFTSDLCLPVNPFCLNVTEAQIPVKQASTRGAQSMCAAFKRSTKRFYVGLGSHNIFFCYCLSVCLSNWPKMILRSFDPRIKSFIHSALQLGAFFWHMVTNKVASECTYTHAFLHLLQQVQRLHCEMLCWWCFCSQGLFGLLLPFCSQSPTSLTSDPWCQRDVFLPATSTSLSGCFLSLGWETVVMVVKILVDLCS